MTRGLSDRLVLLRALVVRALIVTALVTVFLLLTGCGQSASTPQRLGTLTLTIRDAATGEPTSARVELLDHSGNAIVPENALSEFSDCGNLPLHTWAPELGSWGLGDAFGVIQALRSARRDIANPYTGTTQFYADGALQIRLPAGTYRARATKGIEYRQASATVVVAEKSNAELRLDLERWIDLPSEGWYGADDHLHIPRPHPRFDPRLATWMEAEGLHVANFLQMGLSRDLHITPQQSFGPDSVYRSRHALLLSGQENPRTHILGHTIVLGADRFVDLPADYLLYDRVWQEAHRLGAINGYAHWALAGAEEGLAVWGQRSLLDFVEVLNLGLPFYERWYEALDLGIRLAPTAGTDYPCLPSLPGRERFYTRVANNTGVASTTFDRAPTAEAWLEAVREGKTFVTNGPAIELVVTAENGGEALPGDELRLRQPAMVRVRGRVRFDPERDHITTLELVRGGRPSATKGGATGGVPEDAPDDARVEARVNTPADPPDAPVDAPAPVGIIELDATLEIDRTTWLALRATGTKRGETEIDLRKRFSSMLVLERASNQELLRSLPDGPVPRPSAAHTAAVFVTVAGTTPLAEQPRGQEVTELWQSRLDQLERRLAEDRIESWAQFPGRGDGIDLETARANRSALLEAIEAARTIAPRGRQSHEPLP